MDDHTEARFWRYVKKGLPDECWEWRGRRIREDNGRLPYGWVRDWHDTDDAVAHRLAYRLFVGPIPEGRLVLHSCDNPPCVNPQHLYIGTYSDNMADRKRRGRYWGEQVHTAKLTVDDVKRIRSLRYTPGNSYRKLAEEYGVATRTIARIMQRQSWIHI